MELSSDQLPRHYEFISPEDWAQVQLNPLQRCLVESRQADAITALVNLRLDPANVNKFIQEQAYYVAIKDFCEELLSINSN